MEAAYQQATQLEEGNYQQTQQQFAPYVAAGSNALTALQQLLNIGPGASGGATNPILQMLGLGGPGGTGAGNINPATFQGSPGYQYALQQGTQAVTNQAATQGGLGGNQLKALQATGQGLANQNFNNYVNSANAAYQGLVGNVANLANSGQAAVGTLGQIGTTVGAELGANAIGAGGAKAGGILGSMADITGGINQALSAFGSANTANNNQNNFNQLIAALTGGGGNNSQMTQLLGQIAGYQSAASQYQNPYGATGNGMAPIIGNNGLAGGGV